MRCICALYESPTHVGSGVTTFKIGVYIPIVRQRRAMQPYIDGKSCHFCPSWDSTILTGVQEKAAAVKAERTMVWFGQMNLRRCQDKCERAPRRSDPNWVVQCRKIQR